MISFGKPYWARIWQERTDVPFPLLLDQERKVYADYGLQSSLLGNLSPGTLWHYAKQILRGNLPRFDRGRIDQMGGDFVIDSAGHVRYVHRSTTPTDRPPVDDLLEAIRELQPTKTG